MSHLHKRLLKKQGAPNKPICNLWSVESPVIVEKVSNRQIGILKQKKGRSASCCISMLAGKDQAYVDQQVPDEILLENSAANVNASVTLNNIITSGNIATQNSTIQGVFGNDASVVAGVSFSSAADNSDSKIVFKPAEFHHDQVGKEDPYSWSAALQRHGMKLAYCNTVPVALAHYVEELLALDDAFLIRVYTDKVNKITAPLDHKGTNGGSHVVLLISGKIYDPSGVIYDLKLSHHAQYMTKGIFRVVDASYPRGI